MGSTVTTKMDQGWKEKWVAALRSGEFTQAFGVLKAGDSCGCCLYVLTELARQEHPDVGRWGEGSYEDTGDFLYECEDGHEKAADGELAPTIQAVVGLRDGDPIIGDTTAITLNDTNKASFAEIADRVERYL
jgi:hypothetical protein